MDALSPAVITRRGRHDFHSDFGLGDRVSIDGDTSIKATIIGILFRHTGEEIECAWMANGAQQSAWIAAWRLSNVTE